MATNHFFLTIGLGFLFYSLNRYSKYKALKKDIEKFTEQVKLAKFKGEDVEEMEKKLLEIELQKNDCIQNSIFAFIVGYLGVRLAS